MHPRYTYVLSEELSELQHQVSGIFTHTNGLNPTMFPSLKKMESEVVSMALRMMRADEESVGTMSTGGTESILLAVKVSNHFEIFVGRSDNSCIRCILF